MLTHKTAIYAKSAKENQSPGSTKSLKKAPTSQPKKAIRNKKWTLKDVRKHQDKMADGIIPWEEIWEVPGTYTAKEYYNMMDEDCHWELVDNKILVHSPAGMEHQDVVGSLYTLIRTHVTVKGWGIAYTAPAGLEIKGLSNKFEPDIFAISQEKAAYVGGSFCEYVPELVIEVALTKKALNYILEKKYKKFEDYARIGILEYLVIYAPKEGEVTYYHYDNVNAQFVQKENTDTIYLQTINLSFPSVLIKDRNYWRTSIIDQFLSSTVVEKINPKIRVDGVDPKIRVDGVDPKVRVNGVDPKIRVNGVDPKIRVNGVDPKVRIEDIPPKTVVEYISQKALAHHMDPLIRVNGVDPKIRMEGLDIKTRLDGLSISEIEKYLADRQAYSD